MLDTMLENNAILLPLLEVHSHISRNSE